jgi:hypothetical protein
VLCLALAGAAWSPACRRPLPPAAAPAPLVFACGEEPCDARTSYCETIQTDYAPLPSTYTCKRLPASCTGGARKDAGCACFPAGTRCDFCSRLERGGVEYFQRTCIGGG